MRCNTIYRYKKELYIDIYNTMIYKNLITEETNYYLNFIACITFARKLVIDNKS